MGKSFIFIGDVIDFADSDSYDLGFNHILRRANNEEIKDIRTRVEPYLCEAVINYPFNIYEAYRTKTVDGFSFPKFENIEDYRYSVIDLPMTSEHSLYATEFMMSICNFGINRIFKFNYNKTRVTDRITREEKLVSIPYVNINGEITLHNFFNDYRYWNFKVKKMTESSALDIKSLHSAIVDFVQTKDKYPHIYQALFNFNRHREISKMSPFKIVSLISCLELLLVDGGQDRLKSIKQQLQRKVNLLNNRFQNPIDVAKYFKGSDTNNIETIIKIIYDCRNQIAHGTFTHIKNLHQQILKDVDFQFFLDFVILLTKRILQQAILEPDLIVDLKKC